MKGEWTPKTGRLENGENYRIGRIIVGEVSWSATRSKDAPKKWGIHIALPCIKSPTDRYTNIDDAKARVERAVRTWFSWLEEKS